jgi:hypothetical protein
LGASRGTSAVFMLKEHVSTKLFPPLIDALWRIKITRDPIGSEMLSCGIDSATETRLSDTEPHHQQNRPIVAASATMWQY